MAAKLGKGIKDNVVTDLSQFFYICILISRGKHMVFFPHFFFSKSATSHFLLNVLTKNTGRFHNQNYDQNTEYNGISHL